MAVVWGVAVVCELPEWVALVSGLEIVTVAKVVLWLALVVCTDGALLVALSVLVVCVVLVI